MARKKRKKRRWLGSLVIFVMTPLTVWALAFIIWLYWPDITRLLNHGDKPPPAKADKAVQRSSNPSDKSAHEGIGEAERKRLEEILKRKN